MRPLKFDRSAILRKRAGSVDGLGVGESEEMLEPHREML